MHMRQPTCIAYRENLEIFLEMTFGNCRKHLVFRKSSSVAVFYVSMLYFVHNVLLLLYPECFSHVLLFLDFCSKWHNILVLLRKSSQHY